MTHRILSLTVALLCGLLAAPFTPPAMAQPRFSFDSTPGNLPKSVVPARYALSFDLDPARDDFSAVADIDIAVRQPVGAVVLHARDLQPLTLELRQGATVRQLQMTPGPIDESWWLEPADSTAIAPGRYTLHIAYSGRVNRSGVGLFRADHPVAGQPQRMLATQLESVDARSVFPAFDEPAFRAVFELTVRAPRGYSVLSNMPLAAPPQASVENGRSTDGDMLIHRFRPTPPMPSYLVALSVGRFDALAGRAAGVPLRILTAPGKRALAGYAMGVTRQVLPFYSAYFGVPFALPKLDQLAVPSVRQGAMEDWGLISYTEPALLFDPAKSSPRTRRGVFGTVAHEIAHQWFGDLVTAASWEEIWLNEAFATWMANKATARFNPGWHSALARRLPVDYTMAGDSGSATRAIRSGPVSEAAVFDVFDEITYVKGGAVLGMLEHWIGAETFRRGLSAYMRERRFSNATAGDLWFHMAQASQRDVAAVAASWTDQPGFPLVQVDNACTRSSADGLPRTRVTLSQRRMRDGTSAPAPDAPDAPGAQVTPASSTAPLWQIPIELVRGAEAPTRLLLSRATQTLDLPGCVDAPLLVNAGGIGFYRVQYPPAQLDALIARFADLRPADQITLFSDNFALAQAGELPLARWFSLLAQLPRVAGPAHSTLVEMAGDALLFLDDAMAGTPAQASVRAAGRRALAPELARLGWQPRRGDDAELLKLRADLIGLLARFDDAPTVAEALRRFDADAAGTAPLPAAIRAPVIHAAGLHADRTRFDQLLARLKSADGEEDRWLYAAALAGGRDAGRADELLAASLMGVTTPNIAIALPRLVSEHSPFGERAYDFTRDNWDALAALAGHAMFARFGLLPGAAAHFNDPARGTRLLADQQARAGADGAAPAARTAARIAQMSAMRVRESSGLPALLESR